MEDEGDDYFLLGSNSEIPRLSVDQSSDSVILISNSFEIISSTSTF